ncbi:MAG: hypothetical protein PHI66_04880 [Candidatus Pacebacteria bacterium]|nr:hypothetical protein [Candidatus Paceibacterota bacterium]
MPLENFISPILIIFFIAKDYYLAFSGYSDINVILCVFVILILLSGLIATRRGKTSISFLLLTFLVIITTIILFKLELYLPVAHIVDYDSFPYPRHSYISHASSRVFIFLTLCLIPISLLNLIITTRNRETNNTKIDKSTELIRACLKSRELHFFAILSSWLIFFVLFLAYLLMGECNEEAAGLYIVYALVLLPVFFLPVSIIGMAIATRKIKKSIKALIMSIVRIISYVILLEIGLIFLIFRIGSAFYK